VKVNDAVMVAA